MGDTTSYRPQTKLRKDYVFTPVCHSVHRGVSPPVHAGIHPPLGRPSLGRHTPLSRHPTWADTAPPPRADPPGQTATAADGRHHTRMHSS